MVSYRIADGHADHHRRQEDARVSATARAASRPFSAAVENPGQRLGLEHRQEDLLRPDKSIRYHTDCPNAADDYYKADTFTGWNINELIRWKDKGGQGHRRKPGPRYELRDGRARASSDI